MGTISPGRVSRGWRQKTHHHHYQPPHHQSAVGGECGMGPVTTPQAQGQRTSVCLHGWENVLKESEIVRSNHVRTQLS
jgi:hypothetical protein